jgi:hypothetical protein
MKRLQEEQDEHGQGIILTIVPSCAIIIIKKFIQEKESETTIHRIIINKYKSNDDEPREGTCTGEMVN